MTELGVRHPEPFGEWYLVSNTLAILEVADEQALKLLLDKAVMRGITLAVFNEPDRNNELTAVALLGPAAKKLCRGLPLAFT